MQPRIRRKINLAHSALAQKPLDPVVADLFGDEGRRFAAVSEYLRGELGGRRVQKVWTFIVISQQRFDLAPQFVVGTAGFVEE